MRIVILMMALVGTGVQAETIYLKNGTILKGAIVEMSETNITLSTSDLGTVIIKRRSVAKIQDISNVSPAPVVAPPVQTLPPQPPQVVQPPQLFASGSSTP